MKHKISELYPYELRAANLGTCYNSISREIMVNSRAFDLGKLNHENLIGNAKGIGHTKFQAITSNSSAMGDSFFAISGKVSAGFPAFRASMGFDMSNALATSSNQKSFTAYLENEVRGRDIRLLKDGISPETLYKCMTPDFQRYYTQVVTAKPQERLKALQEFTKRFGHGVIYHLDLISCAYAKLQIAFKEEAKSTSTKYGASIGANVKGVEVSSAAAWGNSRKKSFGESNLTVESDVIPHDAPAAKWTDALVKKVMEKSFAIFDSEASFVDLPEPASPQLPKLPDPVKPDDKDVKPKAKEITKEEKEKLEKDLIAENKKKDGQRAVKMSDEDYKKEPEKFRQSDIGEALRKLFALEDDDDTAQNLFTESLGKVSSSNQSIKTEPSDLLGQFMPCGFKTIPWIKLFPDLAVNVPQGWTTMNIAKLCLFVYSRTQFSQYLGFLKDVPSWIHGLDNIRTLATKFESHMNEFVTKHLIPAYNNPSFNEDLLKQLIRGFKKELAQKFPDLVTVYNEFFKHHDFLRKIPLGFLAYTSYQSEGSLNPETTHFKHLANSVELNYGKEGISKMLKDRVRFYPVLTKEGAFKLVWFKGSWQELIVIYLGPLDKTKSLFLCTESATGKHHPFAWSSLDDFLRSSQYDKVKNTGSFKHTFINRTAWINAENLDTWDLNIVERNVKLRGVSYDDFDYAEPNLEIRGIPMFSEYPFDNVKRVLNPLATT